MLSAGTHTPGAAARAVIAATVGTAPGAGVVTIGLAFGGTLWNAVMRVAPRLLTRVCEQVQAALTGVRPPTARTANVCLPRPAGSSAGVTRHASAAINVY